MPTHQAFLEADWIWIQSLLEQGISVVIEVEGILPRDNVPEKVTLWRL